MIGSSSETAVHVSLTVSPTTVACRFCTVAGGVRSTLKESCPTFQVGSFGSLVWYQTVIWWFPSVSLRNWKVATPLLSEKMGPLTVPASTWYHAASATANGCGLLGKVPVNWILKVRSWLLV